MKPQLQIRSRGFWNNASNKVRLIANSASGVPADLALRPAAERGSRQAELSASIRGRGIAAKAMGSRLPFKELHGEKAANFRLKG